MRQPWWSVAAALGLGLGALMGCNQNKQVDVTPDPVAVRPPPSVDTNELVASMPIGADFDGTAEPERGGGEGEAAEAESSSTNGATSSSSTSSSSEPTSASDESPSPGTPTSTTTTTGAEVPMSARDAGASSGGDNVIIQY